MKNQKPSVALIIPGGIGTGANNIGVPVLERIVKLLAREFRITVFSLFEINRDYVPEGFELQSVIAGNNVTRFLKLRRAFETEHARHHFVAVHGFWALPSGFYAVLLGKLFNIKSIVSILGGDAISLPEIKYGQLQRWLPRKLIIWILSQASEVIVLTRYLWDNLKSVGLKRKDIKVIPWGIDTGIFQFREKYRGTTIKFLHIANLHPVKGQETLLRAFKLISDQMPSHLTIVGEGILEKDLVTLANDLLIAHKINFMKPVPYEDLVRFYADADILLHTSLSEGQSEVVTEAMSSGVMVCGTRVGLLYDIPECCVAVPVGDYSSLAHKTLELINDHAKLESIRLEARDWARTHSIYWTVEQLKNCYEE